MAYVIVKPDGTQTRAIYATPEDAITALKRRREIGAQVVWCKYAREPKVWLASYAANGVERVSV